MNADMSKNPGHEKIWRLLAISLDPDSSAPQLYGLVLEGESDQPLMVAGRLLFFREASRAREVLRQHAAHLLGHREEVDEVFFWCDVAQTLYLLQSGGLDQDACVLGAVNALLDLVKATEISMPAEKQSALHSIADYCTTNKDLTKYLEEEGDYSSEALRDAVLWCVGAVAVKSTFV